MRLLCQNIGTRANQEDKQVGKFFQGRFHTVRILDEETLLACAAYVDLNPIRAAMTETLETSEFTAVQRIFLGPSYPATQLSRFAIQTPSRKEPRVNCCHAIPGFSVSFDRANGRSKPC